MVKIIITLIVALAILQTKSLGNYHVFGQAANDFYYYLIEDCIILLFCLLSLCQKTRIERILIYGLVGLAAGKIVDEFVSPYGYGIAQILWNSLVGGMVLILLVIQLSGAKR